MESKSTKNSIIFTASIIVISLSYSNPLHLESTPRLIGTLVAILGIAWLCIRTPFLKQLIRSKQKLIETVFILLLAVFWNQGVYYSARLIASTWKHYDMTTSIDMLVPFVPWTISIYFGCYLFWGVNYYLCATQKQAERNRFFCADILAKCICLLLFLLIPTTNVRPKIAHGNIWDSLMKFLYQIDSADNLFPSIHCLVSWLCWIGVRNRKEIPVAYRHFSLLAAVAVCISTLTTRQHVIADVIGAILIAELCYLVSALPKLRTIYGNSISSVLKFLKLKTNS